MRSIIQPLHGLSLLRRALNELVYGRTALSIAEWQPEKMVKVGSL